MIVRFAVEVARVRECSEKRDTFDKARDIDDGEVLLAPESRLVLRS